MISKRYGWTDDIINRLPAERFFQILKVIREDTEQEEKDKMIHSSFSAWQVIETLRAIHSEKYKPLSFQKYIKSLGLIESTGEKKDYKIEAQKSIEFAEQIKSLDKERVDLNGS